MKIRLEKPIVNNYKVYSNKNRKPRWGFLREKVYLDLYFVYRKIWMESKIINVLCRQEIF